MYQVDGDGEEVYPILPSGDEFYERTPDDDEVYARDRWKNERYALLSSGKEVYASTADGDQFYARYFCSALGERYARQSGAEYYAITRNAEMKFAVDAFGNERYAKNADGDEYYFVAVPRYARADGREVYARKANGREVVLGMQYARDEDGDETYPRDEHQNEYVLRDGLQRVVFAETRDGKPFYPATFEGALLVPMEDGRPKFIPGDDTVRDSDIVEKTPECAYTDVRRLEPDLLSSLGGRSWQTLTIAVQFFVIVALLLRTFLMK